MFEVNNGYIVDPKTKDHVDLIVNFKRNWKMRGMIGGTVLLSGLVVAGLIIAYRQGAMNANYVEFETLKNLGLLNPNTDRDQTRTQSFYY